MRQLHNVPFLLEPVTYSFGSVTKYTFPTISSEVPLDFWPSLECPQEKVCCQWQVEMVSPHHYGYQRHASPSPPLLYWSHCHHSSLLLVCWIDFWLMQTPALFEKQAGCRKKYPKFCQCTTTSNTIVCVVSECVCVRVWVCVCVSVYPLCFCGLC